MLPAASSGANTLLSKFDAWRSFVRLVTFSEALAPFRKPTSLNL
jgi:hypothetical protein